MSYSVKEIYYTLQGEGAQVGRPAVLCRFAGCNLWNGREADRAGAVCRFCDTDFVGVDGPGGGRYDDAVDLADAVANVWRKGAGCALERAADRPSLHPYVVCTGGEPLLQLDATLIDALHARGLEIGVETNGVLAAPSGIDWLCVSPKAGTELTVRAGDELKLVYPQAEAPPELFADLSFRLFYLQPMDGPDRDANIKAALAYCLRHPQWRLSLQTHKLLGIR